MGIDEIQKRMDLMIRHSLNMILVNGIGLIAIGMAGMVLLADITWGIF